MLCSCDIRASWKRHKASRQSTTVLRQFMTEFFPSPFDLRRLESSEFVALSFSNFRKIPAPIKIKLALPPPFQKTPTPAPKARNFMGMGVPAERTKKCQAPIKLAQPFLAPELRAEKFAKGPKIEKINLGWNCQSRLKISISLEMFNPGPPEFPAKKIGVWWVARLKISISIENFNPGGRPWFFFFNLWALRVMDTRILLRIFLLPPGAPLAVLLCPCSKDLRIGNGVGKQGYGNRRPIDDRNPIRKFSIGCLNASKTNE